MVASTDGQWKSTRRPPSRTEGIFPFVRQLNSVRRETGSRFSSSFSFMKPDPPVEARHVRMLVCSELVLVVFYYACLRRSASAFTNNRACYLAGEIVANLRCVYRALEVLTCVKVTPPFEPAATLFFCVLFQMDFFGFQMVNH
jgi:hypothetical protein